MQATAIKVQCPPHYGNEDGSVVLQKTSSAGKPRGNFRDQRHDKTHRLCKTYKNEKLII
jgi:hypothetical protein